MKSIALCMIAKNEESWIARAISSVKPIINEIIVVDTGSSDQTKQIAQAHGARVLDFAWCDDFSAARNFSIAQAKSDWILILDADEVIASQDLQALKTLCEKGGVCYRFFQRHYTDDARLSGFRPCSGEFPELEQDQAGYFESGCVRLFPNFEGIEYRGAVHELVEQSIGELNRHAILESSIRIHHYGHSAAIKKSKNKSSLYTPLGAKKTELSPQDWKNFFELGVEHNCNLRYAQSVAAFKQSLALNPSYISSWINMGYALCELGELDQAIEAQQSALKLDPRAAEAHCNLGVAYLRKRELERAEAHLRRAVAINKQYVNAYCNLARVLAELGKHSEAVFFYQRAVELLPTCAGAFADMGAIYLKLKLPKQAEANLEKALELEPDNVQTLYNQAMLWAVLGRKQNACANLERVYKLETTQKGSETALALAAKKQQQILSA